MFLEKFIFLSACHFLADFSFQSTYLAEKKTTSTQYLAYHALQYTSTFIVFVALTFPFRLFASPIPLAATLILFFSHFILDGLKARLHIVKPLWMDQTFHIAVLLALLSFRFY